MCGAVGSREGRKRLKTLELSPRVKEQLARFGRKKNDFVKPREKKKLESKILNLSFLPFALRLSLESKNKRKNLVDSDSRLELGHSFPP